MDIQNTTIYEQFDLHALQIEDHGCTIHRRYLMKILTSIMPNYTMEEIASFLSKETKKKEISYDYEYDYKCKNTKYYILFDFSYKEKYDDTIFRSFIVYWININDIDYDEENDIMIEPYDKPSTWTIEIDLSNTKNMCDIHIFKNPKAEIDIEILYQLACYDIISELWLQRNSIN